MPRRSYTDAEREHALGLIAEHGIAYARKQTGIPKPTLSRWAKKAGVDIGTLHREQTANAVQAIKAGWEERRSVMVHEIGAVAHMALAQTSNAVADGDMRVAKDAATTMAILVDKAQLLSGGATSRPDRAEERARALQDAQHRARHLVAVG